MWITLWPSASRLAAACITSITMNEGTALRREACNAAMAALALDGFVVINSSTALAGPQTATVASYWPRQSPGVAAPERGRADVSWRSGSRGLIVEQARVA